MASSEKESSNFVVGDTVVGNDDDEPPDHTNKLSSAADYPSPAALEARLHEDIAKHSCPTWMLSTTDDHTVINTVEQELHRLQVLRKFQILQKGYARSGSGSNNSADLERLMQMAARLFRLPVVIIALVDLGCIWIVGSYGNMYLDRQLSRKNSLCSYAVQQTADVWCVPDLGSDERFVDNPLVVDYGARFYAASSLIWEGYRVRRL